MLGGSNDATEGSRDGRQGESVKSLTRALTIVNRLASAERGMTLTALSSSLGLPPSTAHRLLTTLEQERYVQFDPATRLWSIGLQAFLVGSAYPSARKLVSIARPFMRALMEESREAVNLAVEDHGEALALSHIAARGAAPAASPAKPGARYPLHCSSLGKALLAAMREEDCSKLLARQRMQKLTGKTVLTRSELEADLREIRARGYAIDDEELAIGMRCVAAPIYSETGESIAALSIRGTVSRFADDRLRQFGDLVRRKADEITVRLGGVPSSAP